jgi:hypothetical protein
MSNFNYFDGSSLEELDHRLRELRRAVHELEDFRRLFLGPAESESIAAPAHVLSPLNAH